MTSVPRIAALCVAVAFAHVDAAGQIDLLQAVGGSPVTITSWNGQHVLTTSVGLNTSIGAGIDVIADPHSGEVSLSSNGITVGVCEFQQTNLVKNHGITNPDGLKIGLRDDFADLSYAHRSTLILHELLHAWLIANYPGFATNCPECAHALVFKRTAEGLCAMANACPPPKTKDMTELLERAAKQKAKCEGQMGSGGPCALEMCTEPSPPDAYSCPPACTVTPCPPA